MESAVLMLETVKHGQILRHNMNKEALPEIFQAMLMPLILLLRSDVYMTSFSHFCFIVA